MFKILVCLILFFVPNSPVFANPLDKNNQTPYDETLQTSEHRFFISANIGGSILTGAGASLASLIYAQFNVGAKFGMDLTTISEFSNFSPALSFNTTALSSVSYASSMNELMIQGLFRKVGGSGFYFGPQVGVLILVSSNTYFGNTTTSAFSYGGLAGWEYNLSEQFSFGPELHFTTNSEYLSRIKALLCISYNF